MTAFLRFVENDVDHFVGANKMIECYHAIYCICMFWASARIARMNVPKTNKKARHLVCESNQISGA